MKVTLTVAHGPHTGQSYSFEEHDNFIVGRASYAHFRLPKKDRYFSRVHFMIEVNPPFCRLMDMGSRNGTYVNQKRVKTVDIHDGDMIKGGHTVIKVVIEGDAAVSTHGADDSRAAEQTPRIRDKANTDDRQTTDKLSKQQTAEPQLVLTEISPGGINQQGDSGELVDNPPGRFETVSVEHMQKDISLSDDTLALLPDDFVDRINNRPQPVPGYLIVDELGRGGMGVVYRAVCRRRRIVIALKTIRPAVAVNEGDIDRFLREASILKGLEHPHIVTFHEMGETGGELYFVMEYVPGTDAGRLLDENGGPLNVRRAIGIICQLLSALEYAHQKGFVHRDIKPQNMLLTQVEGRGFVKLADFGLARTYQSSRISGLTMMGDVRGTSQYMAPEQITNYRETKPSTDQYGAAATLYHLLTNAYIFDFPDSINRKFQMILQEDPVPVRQRRSEIPDRLAAIVHRGLERDPERRFADVSEMRTELVEFLKS